MIQKKIESNLCSNHHLFDQIPYGIDELIKFPHDANKFFFSFNKCALDKPPRNAHSDWHSPKYSLLREIGVISLTKVKVAFKLSSVISIF